MVIAQVTDVGGERGYEADALRAQVLHDRIESGVTLHSGDEQHVLEPRQRNIVPDEVHHQREVNLTGSLVVVEVLRPHLIGQKPRRLLRIVDRDDHIALELPLTQDWYTAERDGDGRSVVIRTRLCTTGVVVCTNQNWVRVWIRTPNDADQVAERLPSDLELKIEPTIPVRL